MVNVRIAAVITACGVFAWSMSALGSLADLQGIYYLFAFVVSPRLPWDQTGPHFPPIVVAPEFPIMFWLLIASWSGAWLALFSAKFLIPHGRLEAEQLTYVGAILAIFPFALPLVPLFYLRWRKAAEKIREEPEI